MLRSAGSGRLRPSFPCATITKAPASTCRWASLLLAPPQREDLRIRSFSLQSSDVDLRLLPNGTPQRTQYPQSEHPRHPFVRAAPPKKTLRIQANLFAHLGRNPIAEERSWANDAAEVSRATREATLPKLSPAPTQEGDPKPVRWAGTTWSKRRLGAS